MTNNNTIVSIQSNFKNLFIFILATGVILFFLSRAIVRPPNTVEYRYLPRTLDQQMKDAAFEDELFEKMFDGEDIWYRSFINQKL